MDEEQGSSAVPSGPDNRPLEERLADKVNFTKYFSTIITVQINRIGKRV